MKYFLNSKTFLLGLLQVCIGLALWYQGQLEAGLPITINGILMVLLRIVTKEQIVFKR